MLKRLTLNNGFSLEQTNGVHGLVEIGILRGILDGCIFSYVSPIALAIAFFA